MNLRVDSLLESQWRSLAIEAHPNLENYSDWEPFWYAMHANIKWQ